jgi:glycosyltransferase involved in cell wall biosynthesis
MALKISIALATYNGATYLQEQLDSYLQQTLLPDELIISDDGSIDETVTICKNFVNKAPFEVKISQNERNLGPTKNFEKTISECSGDIIFLSDQDDVWLPDKIKLLADILLNNPGTGLAFCNAGMCDENLRPLGYDIWEALGFTVKKQKMVLAGHSFEVFLQYPMIAGMTMAFRSEMLNMLLPFPDLLSCHDIWILLLVSSVSNIHLISDKLAMHRIHHENLSKITKRNLYQQYLKAKSQIQNDRLTYSLEFHKEVFNHININGNWLINKSANKNLLQQKINHAQIRVDMPKKWFKRLLPIAKEIKNQNYKRFSYGFKSALQDLFLRS